MALKMPVIQRVIADTIEFKNPAIPLIRPEKREAIELTMPLKQEKMEPIFEMFLFVDNEEIQPETGFLISLYMQEKKNLIRVVCLKWDHHDVHVMTMLQYLGLKIVRMTIETNFFLEPIGTTS